MEHLRKIFEDIRLGIVGVDVAIDYVKGFLYTDIGYAKIDNIREERVGYPEIIFGQGKSTEQILGIVEHMYTRDSNILITRTNFAVFERMCKIYKEVRFNDIGKIITIQKKTVIRTDSYIAIVSAGTSDLAVVEEAYETAILFGNKVEKVIDVGVAGIHRLLDNIGIIRGAKVIIVIAGMEGALPSVIGGLVDKPIIAVPTSVGYGANFGGLSALLSMINSCASGVSVVNIDNGFGAAYQASMINKL
jgi:pyridinium-3,5-biscarboxylic acid mononucleotide synthase